MKYKHISFDVWNTLVLPNPEYAKRRNATLASYLGVEEHIFKMVYTETKTWIDNRAKKLGESLSHRAAVQLLLYNLDDAKARGSYDSIEKMLKLLFEEFPPIITPSASKVVNELKHHFYAVSIASNSNFVKGEWMHEYLNRELAVFHFGIYSDQELYAKPSRHFFGTVLENCRFPAYEILHVGDDFDCDGGARQVGITPLIIKEKGNLEEVLEAIKL